MKEVDERFGISVKETAINWYRRADRYTETRRKFREQWDALIAEDEFASRRRRLQELTEIFKAQRKRNRLSEAVSTMKEIDQIVCGRSREASQFINVQYNKFTGMSPDEIKSYFNLKLNRVNEIQAKIKEIEDASYGEGQEDSCEHEGGVRIEEG